MNYVTLGFSITTAAISSLSEVSKSGAIFTNTGVLLFAKESLASSTLLIKASRACFPCNLLNPGVFGLKLIGKGKKKPLSLHQQGISLQLCTLRH